MNELIKISENKTMSSREVSELTGKQHSNVMVDIRNLIDQLGAEKGELNFQLSSYLSDQNKELPQYELTKKETLLLVSGYNPILRLKIINRWEALEKPMSDEEMTLMVVNKLQSKVLELKAQNEDLIKKEEYHAPMVDTYHLLMDSGKALDFERAAKNMGLKSRTQLIKNLKSHGYINSTLLPTPAMIDKGYMLVKQVPIKNGSEIYTQTFITMKGVEYIGKKLMPNITLQYEQKNL